MVPQSVLVYEAWERRRTQDLHSRLTDGLWDSGPWPGRRHQSEGAHSMNMTHAVCALIVGRPLSVSHRDTPWPISLSAAFDLWRGCSYPCFFFSPSILLPPLFIPFVSFLFLASPLLFSALLYIPEVLFSAWIESHLAYRAK